MNKAVFITGAQYGTGYGIAEVFAKNCYDVFITSRRGEEAVKAAEKLTSEMNSRLSISLTTSTRQTDLLKQ